MNDDFDFVPPVFLRIVIIITGIYVLAIAFVSLFQSLTNTYIIFENNLVLNLNRLGLVFELVGLLSLLPDIIERQRMDSWEKYKGEFDVKISGGRDILRYLLLTFSQESTAHTEGLIGFTSQVSRLLGLLTITIITFTLPSGSFRLLNIGSVFLSFVFIGYIWLLFELISWKFQLYQNDTGRNALRLYRAMAFWVCMSFIFFLPVLFGSIAVISLLNWLAKHSISKIIATITFPFILLGTICQLIASFI
jgi:hypothetical protein